MSIQNYEEHRPGTVINQQLAAVASTTTPTQMAVVVAPKFTLNRYGRETVPGTVFNSAGQTLAWQQLVNGSPQNLDLTSYTVDPSFTRLYGAGLEASLCTISNGMLLASMSEPSVLRVNGSYNLKGGSLLSALRGREVQLGDVFYCQGASSGVIYRRTVTGFRGRLSSGTFGSDGAGTNSNAGNVASNPMTTSASQSQLSAPAGWSIAAVDDTLFNGLATGAINVRSYGEVFIISVHTAGAPGTATVNIASQSGKFNATNVATTNSSGNYAVADSDANGALAGMTIHLNTPGGNLTTDMVFRLQVIGAYTPLTTSQVVAAGTYTGDQNTTYLVTVTQTNSSNSSFTGAKVSIVDTAGLDTPAYNVAITDNTTFNLGTTGLTMKFHGSGGMPPQAGLRVGDVYYVNCVAGTPSTTNFDTVILDGPAVDTLTFTDPSVDLYSVEMRLPYTGEVLSTAASSGTAWTANATTGITVTAGLALNVTARSSGYQWVAFVNGVGSLYPSWRAVVLRQDGVDLQIISTAAELTAIAGTVDMDNPAGYAAQWCLIGASGNQIGFLNAGGITATDFTTALGTIQNNRLAYELTVISTDTDVWEAALTHVVTASSASNLNCRCVRFGLDSPGSYVVLNHRADTTNYTATVSPYGSGNLLVTLVAGASEVDLRNLSLVAGDLVLINGTNYPIASVLSSSELLLSSGPGSSISPAVAVQIWKADTAASQKAYVIDRAHSLADRRATLVWTEGGVGLVNNATTAIPAMYAAAWISGYRSATRPQTGISRTTVPVYTGAPRMYTRYQPSDLDEVAAEGVMILSQAYAGAPVIIRHQLTTDVSNDILNAEETTTRRLDALTSLINGVIDAVVGVVNVNDDSVSLTRSRILGVLSDASLVPLGADYGPLIDGYQNLLVAKDPTFIDRITSSVDVGLGPPDNRQYVTITGYGSLPAATTVIPVTPTSAS
jgi:hypothetical protein